MVVLAVRFGAALLAVCCSPLALAGGAGKKGGKASCGHHVSAITWNAAAFDQNGYAATVKPTHFWRDHKHKTYVLLQEATPNKGNGAIHGKNLPPNFSIAPVKDKKNKSVDTKGAHVLYNSHTATLHKTCYLQDVNATTSVTHLVICEFAQTHPQKGTKYPVLVVNVHAGHYTSGKADRVKALDTIGDHVDNAMTRVHTTWKQAPVVIYGGDFNELHKDLPSHSLHSTKTTETHPGPNGTCVDPINGWKTWNDRLQARGNPVIWAKSWIEHKYGSDHTAVKLEVCVK